MIVDKIKIRTNHQVKKIEANILMTWKLKALSETHTISYRFFDDEKERGIGKDCIFAEVISF